MHVKSSQFEDPNFKIVKIIGSVNEDAVMSSDDVIENSKKISQLNVPNYGCFQKIVSNIGNLKRSCFKLNQELSSLERNKSQYELSQMMSFDHQYSRKKLDYLAALKQTEEEETKLLEQVHDELRKDKSNIFLVYDNDVRKWQDVLERFEYQLNLMDCALEYSDFLLKLKAEILAKRNQTHQANTYEKIARDCFNAIKEYNAYNLIEDATERSSYDFEMTFNHHDPIKIIASIDRMINEIILPICEECKELYLEQKIRKFFITLYENRVLEIIKELKWYFGCHD